MSAAARGSSPQLAIPAWSVALIVASGVATLGACGGAGGPGPLSDPFPPEVDAPLEAEPPPELRRYPAPEPRPALLPHALDASAAPAREMLDLLTGRRSFDARAYALEETLPLLAYCTDVDEDFVVAALREAAAGGADEGLFTFLEAREHEAEIRRQVDEVERLLDLRGDALVRRVLDLLPAEHRPAPSFVVRVVVGLPEEMVAGLAPLGERRALLIDPRWLYLDTFRRTSGFDAETIGDQLERRIAPELFHYQFEVYTALAPSWKEFPSGEEGGWMYALLAQGVGAWLALDEGLRLDAEGRRAPRADGAAADAIERFERNLARLVAEDTPPEERALLGFTLSHSAERGGERAGETEPWGTSAAALMVDAIVRFGPDGRMREVLAAGPPALIEAYAEVAGRLANVPAVQPETLERVQRLCGR